MRVQMIPFNWISGENKNIYTQIEPTKLNIHVDFRKIHSASEWGKFKNADFCENSTT